MRRKLTLMIGVVGLELSGFCGSVIVTNLPPNTAIVNIDARQDGAATYNSDQSLWYHPFYTGGATQLLEYAVAPGTYSFRAINPTDAAATFPALTSAQTNQIFTAWTYNSPWILDYLVFDGEAETNFSLPQIFDGSPEWPPYSGPDAAYAASLTNGYNDLIRIGPLGRDSTTLTNAYTFASSTRLIFVVPDYGLSDNAGGVSVLVSPANLRTGNLLLNPGAEEGSLTNWTSGGSSNPQVDTGTFDPSVTPESGTYDFRGGSGAAGSLSQIVSLVGNQGITATAIDSGKLFANVSAWEQGFNQGSPGDDAYISLSFLNSDSNILASVASPEIDSHLGSWSNYVAYYSIPAGTRYIEYTMNFVRHAGNDLDAFIDDNSLVILDTLPALALSIGLQTNNVVVSWPANLASGVVLQQSTNLAPGSWVAATNVVSTLNGTNRVFVNPTQAVFYRLSPP